RPVEPTIDDLLDAIGRSPMPTIGLFSELGPVALRAVAESLKSCRVRGGQTIVREGDDASSMFAIVSGSVDIEHRGRGGANVPVATIGAGEFFGEMGLISDAPRIATVRAREDTTLFEVMRSRLG